MSDMDSDMVGRYELRIQKVLPELPPRRPLVPTRYDVDTLGRKGGRHEPMTGGKTVFTPVAQMQ